MAGLRLLLELLELLEELFELLELLVDLELFFNSLSNSATFCFNSATSLSLVSDAPFLEPVLENA